MKFSTWIITVASILSIFISVSFTVVSAQEVSSTPVTAETPVITPTCAPIDTNSATPNPCIQLNEKKLGFKIPNLSTVLTFGLRTVFVIGGLLALVMLLLGAIAWITSGGEKENVSKAQNKLQAAVVGVILIAVVLAIIATLEQVVFKGTICLGLTCPITVPNLLERNDRGTNGVLFPTPTIDPATNPSEQSVQTEQDTPSKNAPSPSVDTPQQGVGSGEVGPSVMILPDTGGHPR